MLTITPDDIIGWTVRIDPPVADLVMNNIQVGAGGEALPWNTYGLEIEFSTHDSAIFAFTHVVAATLQPGDAQPWRTDADPLALGNDLRKVDLAEPGPWRIESDSDHTFELVSPPLRFDTLRNAYRFKAELAKILTESVAVRAPQDDGDMEEDDAIVATTFADWQQRFTPQLRGLLIRAVRDGHLRLTHRADDGVPLAPATCTCAAWGDVGNAINVYNVDDGINIPAARYRHQLRQHDWGGYTPAIILAKYSKFWSSGFSSQMNLPMTLCGYFLYMLRKTCMPDYDALFDGNDETRRLRGERHNRKLGLWYWRHVLLRACCSYILNVRGLDSAHALDADQLPKCALLHVVASKVLTGAMACLSEPLQLQMQREAWNASSTQAIDADQGETLSGHARDWAPYHSALKDLTGLWLKASLMDVLQTQDMALYRWAVLNLPTVLRERGIWDYALEDWTILERLEPLRKNLEWNDLDFFNRHSKRAELCNRVQQVAEALANHLDGLNPNGRVLDPLPPRNQRRFLERDGVPPWEARYDTMYDPITTDADGNALQSARYLVEHRNN